MPFLLFGLLIAAPGYLLLAQDAGERVIKQEVIKEDIYVAGGEVWIDAEVEGDGDSQSWLFGIHYGMNN